MDISCQEAIEVLRKWQKKESIIQGGMIDSLGNNAAIFGCIEHLDERSMRIDARAFSEKAKNVGLVVGLDKANFSFGEWPSAPPQYEGDYQFRYEAFLIVTFPNGSRCELYATSL